MIQNKKIKDKISNDLATKAVNNKGISVCTVEQWIESGLQVRPAIFILLLLNEKAVDEHRMCCDITRIIEHKINGLIAIS